MTIPVIVLTNNRQPSTIRQCVDSLEILDGWHEMFIVDDSGSSEYRKWLQSEFPEWIIIPVADEASGYNAAMQTVWWLASDLASFFFVEDDFVFTRSIDVSYLVQKLFEKHYLAQIVLLRQPWFPPEIELGGVIQFRASLGDKLILQDEWIEHQSTFSGNPTVLRGGQWITDNPWPLGPGSEMAFTRQLLAKNPSTKFAWWGNNEVYVNHIGVRSGYGY